jgi:hypothetical protein
MYEGEEVNTIDLLYETPTSERNGVKVIVPVVFADVINFYQKIEEQLAYFESVYFDVNAKGNIIGNDFNIYRAEHYQVSEMYNKKVMHLCLDNVYYPIDFSKLGIPSLDVPVALRFGLTDGIFPTPNREQIIYTSITKKKILDKIGLVAVALVGKYNENSWTCTEVKDIFTYYSDRARKIVIGKNEMDIVSMQDYTKIPFNKPEHKDYPNLPFETLYRNRDSIFNDYRVYSEYRRSKYDNDSAGRYSLTFTNVMGNKKILIYDQPFVGNKRAYIKSLLPVNTYEPAYFVKRTKLFKLTDQGANYGYKSILGLGKRAKGTWRTLIEEFERMKADMLKNIIDVDATVIPQDWLDARKKKRISTAGTTAGRVKLQGEINCRQARDLQRYVTGKSSKLVPDLLKVEKIPSNKFLHVYGRSKHEVLVDQLYSVSGKQKVEYFVLSDREHNVADKLDFHNFISIDKFMEGKNKPFKRIVTSYLIHVLINTYGDTFTQRAVLNKVSTDLYDKLTVLLDYHRKHFHNRGDDDIYKAMLTIAEEHNLFDETIYTEYKEIKDLLDSFPFIETAMEVIPSYAINEGNERYIRVLTDLFKYHRIRIDYTNYKLKLNEEIIEPITEDMIDELTQNN